MRRVRQLFGALALCVGLAACNVTVTYSTTLEEDGSGVFALAVTFDEEAALQLGGRVPSPMRRLARDGWAFSQTETDDDGVSFEVSHPFADPAELDELFDQLRDARSGGGIGDFEGIDLELAVAAEEGPVASTYRFDGQIDFGTFVAELGPENLAELNRVVDYEIIADLPGDAQVTEGADASLDETGRVVWRPVLGEEMRFAATSTVRNPALFLGILLGGATLGLAAVAGIMTSRRKARRRVRLNALQVEATRGQGFDVEAAAARVGASTWALNDGATDAAAPAPAHASDEVISDTQPHRLRELANLGTTAWVEGIAGDPSPDQPDPEEAPEPAVLDEIGASEPAVLDEIEAPEPAATEQIRPAEPPASAD